jgi:hypothetical protein
MNLSARVKRLERAGGPAPPRAPSQSREAPRDYEPWLRELFPEYVSRDDGTPIALAPHHHEFWRWVWDLQHGVKPEPFVAIWPRGGGKSTSVELSIVAVGARKARTYVLYVSGTQDQADDHVANIAALLESDSVAEHYPGLAERSVTKYGNSKGWRRNRLWTRSGLIVDALGLDTAARGVKLGKQRPDLIVFDDVDDEKDSMLTVEKKVNSITKKLLPAGSSDSAVMFVQNVVHYESVAARLAGVSTIEADFLANRILSGPLPALRGAEIEQQTDGTWLIIRGEPIWEGQDRDVCQAQITEWGIRSFEAEALHRKTRPKSAAFPEFDESIGGAHVCKPFPIPEAWLRWRAVDYGYAVPYCCLWLARSPAGTIYVYRETYAVRKTAREQAYEVRLASAGERIRFTVGDPAMWASQREGEKFKSVADQYAEMGVQLVEATNDRLAGWGLLHDVLSHAAEAPAVLQIFSTCSNLIRTLPMLKTDEHKPDDVNTEDEDHAPDTLRYGLMAAHWLNATKRREPQSYSMGGIGVPVLRR